ncbi:unnamed protein product, partial [Meganyctiphanes norvegica]
TADFGIYKQIWGLFNHEDPSKSFHETPQDGFDRILKRKYILMDPRISSTIQVARRGASKYHISRDSFNPQGLGIACNEGAPFKTVFERNLALLHASGLIWHWVNQEIAKVAGGAAESDQEDNSAITLIHLQAAFFLLVLGISISFLCFLLELVIHKVRKP